MLTGLSGQIHAVLPDRRGRRARLTRPEDDPRRLPRPGTLSNRPIKAKRSKINPWVRVYWGPGTSKRAPMERVDRLAGDERAKCRECEAGSLRLRWRVPPTAHPARTGGDHDDPPPKRRPAVSGSGSPVGLPGQGPVGRGWPDRGRRLGPAKGGDGWLGSPVGPGQGLRTGWLAGVAGRARPRASHGMAGWGRRSGPAKGFARDGWLGIN
jgi:hypothetical protein